MDIKSVAIVFIAVFLVFFIGGQISGFTVFQGREHTEQAKCITAAGGKMYGAFWCSHCLEQKKWFGDAFQYIDYVECGESNEACTAAGIQGYPTWVINGKKYTGVHSPDQLATLSGC